MSNDWHEVGTNPRGHSAILFNCEKTECAYIGRLEYLGYGFYVSRGKCRLRLQGQYE